MRLRLNHHALICAVVVLLPLVPGPVTAAPILVNGSFESGFTNWVRVDQIGSDGTFFLQAGTTSPVNGLPVPSPTDGTFAAMTDPMGPGSHVLYQDFLVPLGTTSGTLTFDLFVGNQATAFSTPNTLDFSTPALNQQARVDVLLGGTDPFTLLATDILLNVFQTAVGDPLVSGYNTVSVDVGALLAANAGSTLRLRFAEVDNVNLFNLGVDRVSLEASGTASAPEPSTLLLFGVGLTSVVSLRRRTRRR